MNRFWLKLNRGSFTHHADPDLLNGAEYDCSSLIQTVMSECFHRSLGDVVRYKSLSNNKLQITYENIIHTQ